MADRFVKSSLLEGPATERNLKTAGVPTERQSSNECVLNVTLPSERSKGSWMFTVVVQRGKNEAIKFDLTDNIGVRCGPLLGEIT